MLPFDHIPVVAGISSRLSLASNTLRKLVKGKGGGGGGNVGSFWFFKTAFSCSPFRSQGQAKGDAYLVK